jgi:methionine-rich copper-binding protein CopC
MSRPISILTASVAAVALLAAAGAAEAHAHLVSSTPAADSTVGHIKHIELHFTEALAPKFSTVDLTMTSMMMGGKMTPDNMKIGKLTTSAAPNDPATLLVDLKAPLAPGGYTLNWHAVAANGHRTEGAVNFKVQ